MVHVHAHDHHMLCLTTGSASGSNDAVQQQLKELNAEAKRVGARLDKARADLLKRPRNKMLQQTVQDLKKKEADLDERRKALEAKLSGATHGHCCLLVPAQQVPAHAPSRHTSWARCMLAAAHQQQHQQQQLREAPQLAKQGHVDCRCQDDGRQVGCCSRMCMGGDRQRSSTALGGLEPAWQMRLPHDLGCTVLNHAAPRRSSLTTAFC